MLKHLQLIKRIVFSIHVQNQFCNALVDLDFKSFYFNIAKCKKKNASLVYLFVCLFVCLLCINYSKQTSWPVIT